MSISDFHICISAIYPFTIRAYSIFLDLLYHSNILCPSLISISVLVQYIISLYELILFSLISYSPYVSLDVENFHQDGSTILVIPITTIEEAAKPSPNIKATQNTSMHSQAPDLPQVHKHLDI